MKGIITADLHLGLERPRCRKDESWITTQEHVLGQIKEAVLKYDVSLFIVGDLLKSSRVHSSVISMFFRIMEGIQTHLLAGNHDLLYHNWDYVDWGEFGTIWNATAHKEFGIQPFPEYVAWHHFNQPIQNPDNKIFFTHQLIFPDEHSKPPNVTAKTAADLLDEYPQYDWIFTGDYHHYFHYEEEGRHVINPGCTFIQDADMIDYEPGILYVDTEKGKVKRIKLDDHSKEGMVTDVYLTEDKERNERIESFVSLVGSAKGISLDYINNLEKRMVEKEKELGEDPIQILNEIIQGVSK